MIQCFEIGNESNKPTLTLRSLVDTLRHDSSSEYWIDLNNPNVDAIYQIEKFLKIDIPTREEMAAIGPSSRLYESHGAVFLIPSIVANADTDSPESTQVVFVLVKNFLISLRYFDLLPFRSMLAACDSRQHPINTKESIFLRLQDEILDRLSDLLERSGRELDVLSKAVFTEQNTHKGHLKQIGQLGNLISKVRESLMSLNRMFLFLSQENLGLKDHESVPHIRSLGKDTMALLDHSAFLINQNTFVLDATLGAINIEQNNALKIFSLIATIFTPPTLIASWYGMNFKIMPELNWTYGYPLAISLMILSALLPYLFFKRRKWL